MSSWPVVASAPSPRWGELLAEDPGAAPGDGVFETLRVSDRRPLLWPRHRARLLAGLAFLELPGPPAGLIEELVDGILAGLPGPEARLRIMVFRPPGGPGPVTVAVRADPLPRRGPASLIQVPSIRPPSASHPPVLKSLARGPFHEANRWALAAGMTDGLLVSESGALAECDSANLFFTTGRTLFTPSLHVGCLAGVTRALVLECARELGVPVCEGAFSPELLRACREIFLTSSLRGLQPVDRFVGPEGEYLPPGGGLRERLEEALRVRAGITDHFSPRPCIPPGRVGRRLSTTRY